MQNDVMVSVYCITYNHKDFIRNCLEGFIKQKTNFKFEIVIYDDCSTDGTREIIKEYIKQYPNLFIPIFPNENRASKEGFWGINMDIFARCKGKYLAMCEGDDYWSDENKLQIQVDYMESHPDFSGCFHKSLRKDVIQNKDISYKPSKEELNNKTEFNIYDCIKGYFIETVSVMYRWDIYKEELINCFPKKILNGDSYFINFFALHGKIGYIDKLMSVKSVGEQGVWNNNKVSIEQRDVKYAYEIVNFPIQINKLFQQYNPKLVNNESPKIVLRNVLNSAIDIKKYDTVKSLAEAFPEILKNALDDSQIKNQLNKKIKKYKKLTEVFALISIILFISLIIILVLFLRG